MVNVQDENLYHKISFVYIVFYYTLMPICYAKTLRQHEIKKNKAIFLKKTKMHNYEAQKADTSDAAVQ